jgi:disulfide oxidoreductase YuzD
MIVRFSAEEQIGVMWMKSLAVVQIVSAPTACAEGITDSWRKTAAWVSGQLAAKYGESVQVDYYDLFDPGCPRLPPETKLPLVLVNGEVLSSGEKISIPSIRKRVESLGIQRR